MKLTLRTKKGRVILSLVIILLASLSWFLLPKQDVAVTTESPKNSGNHLHTMNMSEGTITNTQKNKKLKISVKFNSDELVLTNNDQTGWQDCQLELNATIVKRGYMFDQSSFPAQESIHIPLTKFTRESIAFNASQSKTQNLMIMCSDKTGNSGWNYFSNK